MIETRPLSGVTVLAIEQLMALPFGTQILADLGAEVIAVSPVGVSSHEAVPWRDRTGRGKRQISVKLNEPAGQSLLRDLAGQVDVFAENFRPGVMDRHGLGWSALHVAYPRLIYASVSGFGHPDFLPSPLSGLAAYGPIGEAMSGAMDAFRRSGTAAGPPLALGDIVSSIYATIGILAALRHRDLTGRGQYVDIAMADALLALAELPFAQYSFSRDREGSTTAQLAGYPMGVFAARDGDFFLIVLNEKHWEAFCRLLHHEDWLTTDKFATPADRIALMQSLIVPALSAWAGGQSREDIIQQCRAVGLAVSPVNRPQDIDVDPHYAARQMIQSVHRADGRPLRIVGNPIKLSMDLSRPGSTRIARPGADNRRVLLERFGVSHERYERLVAQGVVGPDVPT
jgi:crotonobetainyl-CoA:carnitine CoA-transferase CaiB-like acyl-CoA transferase